jgi:glutamine amidotransferase
MGWAPVEPENACTSRLQAADAFYFAHSYAAETSAATARSEGVVAVAERGSFLGVQFHPEKSGSAGARFLAGCLSPA